MKWKIHPLKNESCPTFFVKYLFEFGVGTFKNSQNLELYLAGHSF